MFEEHCPTIQTEVASLNTGQFDWTAFNIKIKTNTDWILSHHHLSAIFCLEIGQIFGENIFNVAYI